MKNTLYLLFILLLFTKCHGSYTNVVTNSQAENNNIVLIFKSCNYTQTNNTGGQTSIKTPVISYITENLIPEVVTIDNDDQSDTLIINSINPLLIEYLHLSFSRFYYLFKPGDTAIFRYEKYKPICSINRDEKDYYNVNFFMERERKTNPELIPTIQFVSKKDYPNLFKKAHDINLANFEFLDSLHKAGKIKEREYTEYQSILRYRQFNTLLNYMHSNEDAKKLYSAISKYEKEDLINNDSLIYNTYYHDFLSNYLAKDILEGQVVQKSSNQRSLDYIKGFEKSSSILPDGKSKDILLFNCLLGIYSNYSISDFQKFNTLFKIKQDRKKFIEYIEDNLLFAKDIESGKSILMRNDQQKIGFQDLLNLHKGNIIYIDFWASWCGPCRISMPASISLQKSLKNKKVVFIYISLDENLDKWKKAAKEEKLINNSSYILLNSQNSDIVKSLKLQTIPRYIIVNKQGKIINDNAPSPDAKQLPSIIESLLKL